METRARTSAHLQLVRGSCVLEWFEVCCVGDGGTARSLELGRCRLYNVFQGSCVVYDLIKSRITFRHTELRIEETHCVCESKNTGICARTTRWVEVAPTLGQSRSIRRLPSEANRGGCQGASGGGTDAAAAFRSLLLLLGGRGRWRTLALDGLGMGVVSGCTPCRIKCRRSAVLRSFHLFFVGEYHHPSCASSVGVRRSH